MRKHLTACGQRDRNKPSPKGPQKRSPAGTRWTSNRFQRLVAGSPPFSAVPLVQFLSCVPPGLPVSVFFRAASTYIVLTEMEIRESSATVNRDSATLGAQETAASDSGLLPAKNP